MTNDGPSDATGVVVIGRALGPLAAGFILLVAARRRDERDEPGDA